MKKIAFVHVPKAAGGSIKRWLQENIGRENFVYTGHFSLGEHGVFEYEESFCVVRNTYDRLISLYTWMNSKLPRVIKKASNAENEVNLQRALALKEAHDRGMIPFFETYKELNWTTLSQLHFIKNVDHILKYERLNDDFMLIQKKLNCFAPLNKTTHVQPKYSKKQFYTLEFKEYVMKNFEEELDFFHYSLPEV
jgi:hypothetical protein